MARTKAWPLACLSDHHEIEGSAQTGQALRQGTTPDSPARWATMADQEGGNLQLIRQCQQFASTILSRDNADVPAQALDLDKVVLQHQPPLRILSVALDIGGTPVHAVTRRQAMGGTHQGGILCSTA